MTLRGLPLPLLAGMKFHELTKVASITYHNTTDKFTDLFRNPFSFFYMFVNANSVARCLVFCGNASN